MANHLDGKTGYVHEVLAALTDAELAETRTFYRDAYDQEGSGMTRWQMSKLLSTIDAEVRRRD